MLRFWSPAVALPLESSIAGREPPVIASRQKHFRRPTPRRRMRTERSFFSVPRRLPYRKTGAARRAMGEGSLGRKLPRGVSSRRHWRELWRSCRTSPWRLRRCSRLPLWWLWVCDQSLLLMDYSSSLLFLNLDISPSLGIVNVKIPRLILGQQEWLNNKWEQNVQELLWITLAML